ncbi:MAG: hypothetical protein IKZ25_05535 [Clostridia bacterium]|nr:hypothetical protein [Clostridia bacterium]
MKTNYQLTKNAFGVITFSLSAISLFNESLIIGLLLLLGYALILEEDKWMAKQALQGLFISLFGALSMKILSLFSLNITFQYERINLILLISVIIKIILAIFIIMGICRTAKGKDADLPFFTVMANKALGITFPKKEEEVRIIPEEDTWICSCGRENVGKFCAICGKEKEE